MGTLMTLLMCSVVAGLVSVVAYVVIKRAVKDALREYHDEQVSKDGER